MGTQEAHAMAANAGVLGKGKELVEEYGFIAVGIILVLFAIEMVVLISLLEAGVDLAPFTQWFDGLTGWNLSATLEVAGTWAIAYAITRVLKPFQLAVAFVLTPIVANLLGKGPAKADNEE
jgi:hypothetical protein